MRFSNPLKICLLILCLSQISSATGTPQFRGANFFMKEIKLNKGKVALVDDEDFDFLNQLKWYAHNNNGYDYAVTTSGSKRISMHRLIMQVNDHKIMIDHKDRNTLNNQRNNLRKCNHSQNNANRKKKDNATSKYLGVSLHRRKGRKDVWRVTMKGSLYVGSFKNEIDAAKAYNEAAKKYHGEFANLNKI